MNKKKKSVKTTKKKPCSKNTHNLCDQYSSEKVYGQPHPAKGCSKQNCKKDTANFPKLIFKKDSWWIKIQRFFGFIK